MSEDPTGLAAGPDQYAYCNNSPTNGVDPSGLINVVTDGNGRVIVYVTPQGRIAAGNSPQAPNLVEQAIINARNGHPLPVQAVK